MITTIKINKICNRPQEVHNEMCHQVFSIGNGFTTSEAEFYQDDIVVAYSKDSRIIGMWTFLEHCSLGERRHKDNLLGGSCVFFKWFGWHENKIAVFGIDVKEFCRNKSGLEHDCLIKKELSVKFNNMTDALTFFNVIKGLGYKFSEPDLTSVWNPSKEFEIYANYEKFDSFYFSFGKKNSDNYDKIDCETFLWQCACFKKEENESIAENDSRFIINDSVGSILSNIPVPLISTAFGVNDDGSEYPLWDDTNITTRINNTMTSSDEEEYIKTIEKLEQRLNALEQLVKKNSSSRYVKTVNLTNPKQTPSFDNEYSHYSKQEDDDPYTNFFRYGNGTF